MKWLLAPWHAYCRWWDRRILWPVCLNAAHGNLEHARGAFMVHTLIDPAWRDLSDARVNRIVNGLTLPRREGDHP